MGGARSAGFLLAAAFSFLLKWPLVVAMWLPSCFLWTLAKTPITRYGLDYEPCWTRTSDPLIKSEMLYQLS